MTNWLLLDGNRLRVAFALGLLPPLVVLAVGRSGLADTTTAIVTGDPVDTLFQALVAGVITSVTLVVTISQLVLSQELGPLGDQWSRLADAMDVRERIEDHLVDQRVAAAQPSTFLAQIARDAADAGGRLVDRAATLDADHANALRELGEEVRDDAGHVAEELDDATFGSFGVVHAGLELHYSPAIHRARQLLRRREAELDDETRDEVEHLVRTLQLFAAGREHVKTLWFQWDLVDLSRAIIVAALPALSVAIAMLAYFEASTLKAHAVFGVGADLLVLAAAIGLALAPFAILLSFMLRVVTVARRTLAIGPLVLLDDQRELLDRGR